MRCVGNGIMQNFGCADFGIRMLARAAEVTFPYVRIRNPHSASDVFKTVFLGA